MPDQPTAGQTEQSASDPQVMHLSVLLGRPVMDRGGEAVGRVDDVIVRLRGGDYPLATGLVMKVGGRRVYLGARRLAEMTEQRVTLAKEKIDLRSFERRPGEVLLREDILGHRLIDVSDVELVRAYDVELDASPLGWVLKRLDTRRPARFFGLVKQRNGHAARDWKAFEPLLGHKASASLRATAARLRKLKPAQIADLLEDADSEEGSEILDQVHADPELEADVFEELDPDLATKLLGEMPDSEVALVLTRMQADDAADAVASLRQDRRLKVLDLLSAGDRTKIMTLLGFSPSSAGGLMSTDALQCPEQQPVGEVLRVVAAARTMQPEALNTVHAVGDAGHLVGTATLIQLLQADPAARLREIMDHDSVRVTAETDAVDIALLMADFNLITVPVVDEDNRVLGVVTVDDVLEATIPDDWRRREPAPKPPANPEWEESEPVVISGPPGLPDTAAVDD
jgi:hypothetical protein